MIKDICIEFNLFVNNINFDLVIRCKNLQETPYSCYLRFSNNENREKVIFSFKTYLFNGDDFIRYSSIESDTIECLHVKISTKELIEKIC